MSSSPSGFDRIFPRGALVEVDADDEITAVVVRFGDWRELIGLVAGPADSIDVQARFDTDGRQLAVVTWPEAANDESETFRALVIDDEPQNRQYYERALASLGCSVMTARTGAEGIDRFIEQRSHLVMVDVRLPDLNGYEVVRRLRAHDRDSAYVVLMSADPSMVAASRTQQAGADLAMVGPIAPSQLEPIARQAMASPDATSSRSVPPATVTSVRSDAAMVLRVFGGLALRVDGEWLDLPSGRSSEIIAALARRLDGYTSAENLGQLAWEDGAPSSGSLYTAMSRLRSWLDDVGHGELVTSSNAGYRLELEPWQVDSHVFSDLAAGLLNDEPGGDFVEQALDLLERFDGEPFERCVGRGSRTERTRLLEARARLEERVAVRLIVEHNYGRAISVARDLAQTETWRENAWSVLALALYYDGRQREALQTLSTARHLLATSIGVEPGPTLTSVERLLLDQSEELNDRTVIERLLA